MLAPLIQQNNLSTTGAVYTGAGEPRGFRRYRLPKDDPFPALVALAGHGSVSHDLALALDELWR